MSLHHFSVIPSEMCGFIYEVFWTTNIFHGKKKYRDLLPVTEINSSSNYSFRVKSETIKYLEKGIRKKAPEHRKMEEDAFLFLKEKPETQEIKEIGRAHV